MLRRQIIVMLIALFTIGGLMACGKRGEPYRPSDVPVKTDS